jgi:FAD/FMN-containing dehydrogenase
VRASTDEHADLFWGLRGGGGNFGVVTSFEFRLHPVGPLVTAGAIIFTGEAAGDLLRFHREWVEEIPDELTTVVSLATAPAATFLPEEMHGKRVVAVSGCYAGSAEEGARALRRLKELRAPRVDLIGPMPYTQMQRLVDGQWGAGYRNYFKSSWLPKLDAEAIETLVDAHARATSPETKIQLYHVGGAVARVPSGTTAFAHRDTPFLLNIAARWSDPAESDLHIAWVRDLHDAIRRFATGGVYVNFLGDEGKKRVLAAYDKPTFQRLVELKRRYDPTNFFRTNQNIPPDAMGVRM